MANCPVAHRPASQNTRYSAQYPPYGPRSIVFRRRLPDVLIMIRPTKRLSPPPSRLAASSRTNPGPRLTTGSAPIIARTAPRTVAPSEPTTVRSAVRSENSRRTTIGKTIRFDTTSVRSVAYAAPTGPMTSTKTMVSMIFRIASSPTIQTNFF